MRDDRLKTLFSIVSLAFTLPVFLSGSCASPSLLAPKITFIAPPGNVYSIGDVTVAVSVSNFSIVDKQGQVPVSGEGHLHYFLDVTAPIAQRIPAMTTPGTCATTASTSYTWSNVGSGMHIVSVELVNNDDSPLSPPVVSSMQVLVVPELGAPHAVILSPRDGATISPGDVSVSIETSNLILVENTGQNPTSGEGHVLYFMDVIPPTYPGTPATTDTGTYAATAATSYAWHNVPSGVHTFYIEMVNDDDTPLSPAVVATVTVTVSQ
jgi:hypothetical protein